MQGHDMTAMTMPKACQTGDAAAMPGMDDMASRMEAMGAHQKGFLEGMMQTQGPMMQGMMAEDADIAFACAMIAHHQGAISMANVELQQGDSAEMKEFAQKVIDAQSKEIDELTKWIEGQAQ